MECSSEYSKFLSCKKKRDITLFDRIQKWEQDHFKSLTAQNKTLYKQGLNNKLSRLSEELEVLPTNYWYQNKRQRYEADIEQLRWRLFYLNKLNAI